MARTPSRQLVPPARVAEIAELAEAVADEHCPNGGVDPEAVADANGITISFGPYQSSFDGMLEHRAGRFHIYCNLDRVRRRDSPRARFTLAHELGHYYLDEHRNALAAGLAGAHGSQCQYESRNLVEQEADHFASNLLMPPRRFVAAAKGLPPGLEGIMSLARRFNTSITSTAIRYAATDVAPCAVIKWSWTGYAWKWLSTEFFRARFRRTIESRESVSEGSPTWRALNRELPPDNGFFEAGTTASAWFPSVRQGQLRDLLFIEQAIPLGRFGVLTFLYPLSEKGVRNLFSPQSDTNPFPGH
ncbi:MAG: ImmA/IrrE family metallo-endopeptidase [Phycisphaerae bacterium]|nr:ImmA/IrrE family metallo-endopeptidase [Phycisphaerae bacterium]